MESPDLTTIAGVVYYYGGWGVALILVGLIIFSGVRTWIVPWPVAKQMLSGKDQVIALKDAQIDTLTKANDTLVKQLSDATTALGAFKKFFDEVEVSVTSPHNGAHDD